jgi:hypothetical protein
LPDVGNDWHPGAPKPAASFAPPLACTQTTFRRVTACAVDQVADACALLQDFPRAAWPATIRVRLNGGHNGKPTVPGLARVASLSRRSPAGQRSGEFHDSAKVDWRQWGSPTTAYGLTEISGAVCVCNLSPFGHSIAPEFLQVGSPGVLQSELPRPS